MPLSFVKDPAENLDYQIDWTGWLAGDTISSSTWVADVGITKGVDTHTTTTATVWLSGGTAGTTYAITNTITTAGGRTGERSIYVQVANR